MNIKKKIERGAIWFFTVVIIGGSIWGLIKLSKNPGNTNDEPVSALAEPVNLNDWSEGNPNAKVVLVEYSDFQCPACAAYYPIVKQIADRYSNKLLVVYRHFPLPQHKYSKLTAAYAEAAGRQGKFWEMHNKLFANQSKWSNDSNAEDIIKNYAGELGLDMAKLAVDLQSSEIDDKINSDIDSGYKSGIEGTPAFFLNNQKITNLNNFSDLEYDIQQAIQNIK